MVSVVFCLVDHIPLPDWLKQLKFSTDRIVRQDVKLYFPLYLFFPDQLPGEVTTGLLWFVGILWV